jgi:hypothetical protein
MGLQGRRLEGVSSFFWENSNQQSAKSKLNAGEKLNAWLPFNVTPAESFAAILWLVSASLL